MLTHPLRILSILLAICGCAALAGSTPSLADTPIYREELDMLPGETRAVDDPLARSPGGRVQQGPYVSIQANVDAFGQNIVGDAANEPSIAVSPLDPNIIAIGWRQFDTISSNFRQGGWAYSTDGGQSWTFPGSLTPGTFRSDPVLEFDNNGDLFYQSLQQSFDCDVFKSEDGGQTFGSPVPEYGGDKNWMVVDKSGGIGDGNIYGTWQRPLGCCGFNIMTRSTDGGESFEFPVPVQKSPGIGTMAVGPDGTLWSAGIDEDTGQDINQLVIAKSSDAEDPQQSPTFTGQDINLGGGLAFQDPPNPAGLLGQINVAVDHSFGPTHGNVYVLASVDPFGGGTDPIEVRFIRSEDNGQTWTAPIRVNDDPPGDGDYHWMAAFSVAPNGRIDAIWNDTRNSGQANLSQLYYSYSYDGGDTWSTNVPASPEFNTHVGWPQQNKIGDYYTIVSDRTGAGAAYSATFNGEQDLYYIRLFPDCNHNGISDVIDVDGTTSQDCNRNDIPDECEGPVTGCGPAGYVPDGFQITGAPLQLSKDVGGQISMTWSPSCLPLDSDYEIYEGQIGDFASHVPKICSTGGATVATFTPAAGDTYYLIVPTTTDREGSYGTDSSGVQRPQSGLPCLEQLIGACLVN